MPRYKTLSLLKSCFFVQLLLLASSIRSALGNEIRNRRLGAPPQTEDDHPTCDYSNEELYSMNENVKTNLLERGFTVREGRFHIGDFSGFASNPGTPYFPYFLNEQQKFSTAFKMNATSAVLFLGCTPSSAKYFSWRSYAFNAKYKTVFASLGDSTNNLVINTTSSVLEDSSGKLTAVVTTADGTTLSTITTVLEEAGAPSGIVNVDAIPSTRVNLIADPSLNFMMLHRANIWTDKRKEIEYAAQVRRIFLIHPPSHQEFDPLPEVPLRVPGNGKNEIDQPGVQQDLNMLHDTIVTSIESASYRLVSNITMFERKKDGFECIENRQNCKGDNRDARYIDYRSYNGFKKKDLYVIVGTNSAATGKCVYTSFGLYQLNPVTDSSDQLIATNITIDDSQIKHSASAFGIDNDKLIAYVISRNCNKIPRHMREYCLKVGYDPVKEIPSKTAWALGYRAYLDPETKTGPLSSELVLPQILKFQPV